MQQFAPFEPDKASFNPTASALSVNAIPVADGWGPMPSLVPFSDALPSRCVGAAYVRNSDGGFFLIAGTQTRLYRLTGTTWTDISGPSAPYAVPDADRWQFARYGTRLIAAALGKPLQFLDVDSGTNFADLPNAPQAKYVTVAGDFVVAGYLVNEPYKLKWSGINDSEYWTVGERNSDEQQLPDGDEITGLFGAPKGAYVFQRNAMRTMAFNPASGYVFTIDVAHPSRGSLAPLSIVQIGPGDFEFFCNDGLFRGWGQNTAPIGVDRVDKWFFGSIDVTDLSIVRGVLDPFEKIAWFQYPNTDGGYTLLGHKWPLDRFCTADNAGVTELASIVTQAATIESISDTIESVDVPIDSRLFAGGAPIFAGFTTDNKLAIFDGAPRAATLATAEIELFAPKRSYIDEARVYADTIDLTLSVGARDYLGGPQTFTTPSAPNTVNGLAPVGLDTRLSQYIVTIAEGATWTNCVGIDPIAYESGDQ
jgi:hypothetical protein